MIKGCRGSDRCAGPRSYYTIVRLTYTANTLYTGCLRNSYPYNADFEPIFSQDWTPKSVQLFDLPSITSNVLKYKAL